MLTGVNLQVEARVAGSCWPRLGQFQAGLGGVGWRKGTWSQLKQADNNLLAASFSSKHQLTAEGGVEWESFVLRSLELTRESDPRM